MASIAQQPTLPARVGGVSIYPGDRGMFGASVADALMFVDRHVGEGNPEPLILGAMRPATLGREVIHLADLRRWVTWDESAACHDCGAWKAAFCNVDGFHYCDGHYPENLR